MSAGIGAGSREAGAIDNSRLRGLCNTLHVLSRMNRVAVGCVWTARTVVAIGDRVEALVDSCMRGVRACKVRTQ